MLMTDENNNPGMTPDPAANPPPDMPAADPAAPAPEMPETPAESAPEGETPAA